jgi:hypothetical protein
VLTLSVIVTIAAIALGSTLIVTGPEAAPLALSRQKTDRQQRFARAEDAAHEHPHVLRTAGAKESRRRGAAETFSEIISSETARLTRLINNVPDFARMERGEKEYKLEHAIRGVAARPVRATGPSWRRTVSRWG